MILLSPVVGRVDTIVKLSVGIVGQYNFPVLSIITSTKEPEPVLSATFTEPAIVLVAIGVACEYNFSPLIRTSCVFCSFVSAFAFMPPNALSVATLIEVK